MFEGPLAALDAIEQATGEKEVTAIGYCLGGTLLASTLSWMTAKGDDRIKAATFFTTLVDFTDPGELGVFIDEEQLAAIERSDGQARLSRRRRDGDDLQHAARQRPDLVVRDQQLPAGQGPVPVRPALLELRQHAHAGGDAQLLPAQAATTRTRWSQPGGDLPRRRADRPAPDRPAGLLGLDPRGPHRALEEHLRRDADLPGPEASFVLAGSGHIAGVVNPPTSGKYGYWTNDELPPDPDAWLARRDAARGLVVARTGRPGTPSAPARWSRRACPAPASCRRSRRRRAATSRSAPAEPRSINRPATGPAPRGRSA